ncbi:predicted protein [Nematostella vectensis]|uniref:Uncharacterized protein n=1 Tax=Nematostella vectensis TaxID=45351 RepID=A7RJK9_NEMVE|nr:predicted protein [Nematostella vectensis]|eukprot:XP_001640458.1 predicted protein [Nematostella vectensis]
MDVRYGDKGSILLQRRTIKTEFFWGSIYFVSCTLVFSCPVGMPHEKNTKPSQSICGLPGLSFLPVHIIVMVALFSSHNCDGCIVQLT